MKANDVFMFYVASHGKTLKVGADYYYLPPSMDGFSDEQIRPLISNRRRKMVGFEDNLFGHGKGSTDAATGATASI